MAAGDHITVARKRLFFPYYHHGIDVGDGTVIHLTGRRKKDAKVIQTSLDEFLNGGEKEVIEYVRFIDALINYKSEMRSAHGREHWLMPLLDEGRIEEIRKRIADIHGAVSEARKYLNKKGYDLFASNCEHFAVFCKTGLAVSFQSIEHQKLFERISSVSEPRSPF